MKKTYIAPDVLIVDIETQFVIANSLGGGVADGCSLGNGFNSEDVSYEGGSRSNLWGED